MQVNSLNLRGRVASYVDWNQQPDNKEPDNKEPANKLAKVHFYAANGYPVQVYEPLMKQLSEKFELESLHNRAQWPNIGQPKKHIRWQTYANDLIHFLETRHNSPVIGIGHSMGATSTIFAAAKRPDLFSQIILIEPAALTQKMSWLLSSIPLSLRKKYIQPGKSTLTRRNRWQNRSVLRSEVDKWKSLEGIHSRALDSFANYLVIDKGDDVGLAFPREWEAHNYFHPSSIWTKLKKVSCPITVIRSEAGMFFDESMWAYWKKLRPQDHIEYIPNYGHLLPLQVPELCAEKIEAAVMQQLGLVK